MTGIYPSIIVYYYIGSYPTVCKSYILLRRKLCYRTRIRYSLQQFQNHFI